MPPARLGQTPPFASMNTTEPPDNSDLMSRLRNFLPQMESANKELLSNTTSGTDLMRLDTNLQSEEGIKSDTDDDETEKASKTNPLIQEVGSNDHCSNDENAVPAPIETLEDAPKEGEAAPTIQLEFTLGNMNGNPLMKLLSNDGDGDKDEDSRSNPGESNEEDPSVAARKQAIATLLKEESKNSTANEKKVNLLQLDGSTKRTEKKRLITELS